MFQTVKLSNAAYAEVSKGHIVDLITNDANAIIRGAILYHNIWKGPLEIIVGFGFTYYQIGPSVFVVLLAICILLPLQSLLSRSTAKYKYVVILQLC